MDTGICIFLENADAEICKNALHLSGLRDCKKQMGKRSMNEKKYDFDLFCRGLEKLEIFLSDEQIQKFLKFYEMMVEKNKFMNLTAVTDFEDVVEKHFLDSLCLNQITDLSKVRNMIDLGTGAGFPGIPLKIVYPNISMVLIDSLNKRISFLGEVIQNLDLNGIEAVHGRAEEIGRNGKYREKYDLCVSRAVANLSVLCEYCIPFVEDGGYFIAYKGPEVEDELKNAENSIQVLGGKVEEVKSYQIPETDMGRTLIKIRKIKKTPKKYPRKAGTPSKNPL